MRHAPAQMQQSVGGSGEHLAEICWVRMTVAVAGMTWSKQHHPCAYSLKEMGAELLDAKESE